MMQEDGEKIGRLKVHGLLRKLELVSKQPGSHAYKQATVERPDIPNILNQEFEVPVPNQVWCGDITYIWAQGKWHYLAVVLGCGLGVVEQAGCGSGHQGARHGLRTAWWTSRAAVSLGSGTQYGSRQFRQQLWRYCMRQNMSSRGKYWDNAPIERMFRSLN